MVPADAKGRVKLPEATRQAVDAQLEAFVASLQNADVASDEFQAKLQQAFQVGRKEIADATTLTNSFTSANFAKDAESPAYLAIQEMRELFDQFNPSKQGNLFAPTKVLGVPVPSKVFGLELPWGDRLTRYLRRYESADSHMSAIQENVVAAKDEVGRGVSDLGTSQTKLWAALEKLEAAVYFIHGLDQRLSTSIESIRTAEPDRARALEQEVLYYIRQNQGDLLATQALTVNAHHALGQIRRTGREAMNGCDRVSTLGMAAMSLGVTMARSLGVQMKTMAMLKGANASVEGLVEATGTALSDHAKATTEFASDPLFAVQKLQAMFDKTYEAMEIMDNFRSQSLLTMESNNAVVRGMLDEHMQRIRNDQSATAGNLPAPVAAGGIAL
ncbi:toxic anion resistance protein [Variovorax sp. PBL-H6]|uniref:toxic anion resistance protein n=2 Tax=Variovorax TaxID=34072 RepID=UPI0013A56B10|nr:toxic anion resistance protein [Variovorax sp. PBL-H6]